MRDENTKGSFDKRNYITSVKKVDFDELFMIFHKFASNDSVSILSKEGESLTFFEVKSEFAREKIQKFLFENLIILEDKKILSNKKKPLYFTAFFDKFSSPVSWRFEIYQKRARASVFLLKLPISNISYYAKIPQILVILTERYSNLKYLEILKHSQKSFEDKILFLDEESLWILFRRTEITLFEKNQVCFTYEKLKSSYEENTSKIDDFTTYSNAEKNNLELKPILEICEKISSKFEFEFDL